jgi:hypothetical protein
MARNFLKENQVVSLLGSISTTAQTHYSAQVDTANYEGVAFLAAYRSTGASTGTAALTIVGTDTSTAASTNYTALNGASITVRKSTTLSCIRTGAIDCYRPQYRYLKAKSVNQAKITTLNIIGVKYGPRYGPVTQSTAVAAASHLAATVAASFVTCIEAT